MTTDSIEYSDDSDGNEMDILEDMFQSDFCRGCPSEGDIKQLWKKWLKQIMNKQHQQQQQQITRPPIRLFRDDDDDILEDAFLSEFTRGYINIPRIGEWRDFMIFDDNDEDGDDDDQLRELFMRGYPAFPRGRYRRLQQGLCSLAPKCMYSIQYPNSVVL